MQGLPESIPENGTGTELSAVIEEVDADDRAQQVLANLARGQRILPEVQRHACIADKLNFTAADLAAEAGHDDLSTLLRKLMRSNQDNVLGRAEREFMS